MIRSKEWKLVHFLDEERGQLFGIFVTIPMSSTTYGMTLPTKPFENNYFQNWVNGTSEAN